MILPKRSLVTIYKSFIRPHLDYGDIIFGQVFNKSFNDNVESIPYNASLAITGAIRDILKEKLHQDTETTCHYLLHCPNYTNERSTLLNIVSTINENSLTSCDATTVKLLLYGDKFLDTETNYLILNASVDFILLSKRLYRIIKNCFLLQCKKCS